MGKPYQIELGIRVVAFVEEDHRVASRHFHVSPWFVNNLILLKAEKGLVQARRQGRGADLSRLPDHIRFVRQRLEASGGLTPDELCVELAGSGASMHRSSVGLRAVSQFPHPDQN